MKIKKLFIVFLFVLSIFFISCNKEKTNLDNIESYVFDIHTEKQNQYLNGPVDYASIYAKGREELGLPNPITLSWKDANYNESKIYNVVISLNEDLSNGVNYSSDKTELSIYNLFIKKMYYYKVTSGDEVIVKLAKFIINCNGPRNLYIDGVTNSRDIGGYITSDNKIVKQGLIFRTSKFNEDESSNIIITENGINTLVKDFGVKTEIDLRRIDNNESGNITSSPLGNNVNYVAIPMRSDGNILLLNNNELIELFKILGDESNYPLVFHCSIGTDRTGFIAFVLNLLLGVSTDDLYRDYSFSNFGKIGSLRGVSDVDTYIKYLNDYVSGNSLQQKMYNYLVSIGVSSSDLDSFINLMKEDYINYEN